MNKRHFNFILSLCFSGSPPNIYSNSWANTISGQTYTSKKQNHIQYWPTFLEITDVPDYLEISEVKKPNTVSTKKRVLYEGYMIDLTRFEGIEDLLAKNLSRNPRKNLRAKKRKLEQEHDITYRFYWGAVDKSEYDRLFDCCFELMKARFHQKKIHNRFLLHWRFFHELFYPKILAKEASLNIIYDGETPITITLNFHHGDIVFSFIQIYDVTYHKYSLGDVAMLKNLEWSYENGFNVWDVSKGATENKRRWCNQQYAFETHMFYKKNNLLANLQKWVRSISIGTKKWLRQKGIIGGILQLDSVYYYVYRKKVEKFNWKK